MVLTFGSETMWTPGHARRPTGQHRCVRKQTLIQYHAPSDRDSRHQSEEASESSLNVKENHEELEHSRRRSPLRTLQSLQVSPSRQEQSTRVRRWLSQIDEVQFPTGKENRPHTDQGPSDARSKQAAISQLRSLQKTSNHRQNPPEKSRRRHSGPRCHSSSDSSFLQPIVSPQPSREPSRVLLVDVEKQLSRAQQSNHKRKPSLSNSVSAEPKLPQPDEFFHKRQRHKTKEDRYATKARKSKVRGEEEKRSSKPKSKTRKRGDAIKISRVAGDQLIRNFASSKIAQHRLTMRPGKGIFRNGKASSPSRKPRISDLAFSEMDFLSHAKAKSGATGKEVVLSKHGQKMKLERARTRNEISTYFAPWHFAHNVDGHHTSAAFFAPYSEKGATLAFADYGEPPDGHDESPTQRSIVKERFLGFGASISSPRKFSLPTTPPQPIYVRPGVETDLSASSSLISYVRWSDTDNSGSRSIRSKKRAKLPRERDTTDSGSSPSVIRKRLLDSGLLEGLGVGRSVISPSNAQSHHSPLHQEDALTRNIQHIGSRYPRAESRPSVSPRSYQTTHREHSHSHVGELRRRQIEAARRAIEPSGRADVQDGRHTDVPRNLLASRAYLLLPSSVPRRAATTTPMRQSSQNRILSRSSLQHETLQEFQRIDPQSQLADAALHNMDVARDEAEIWEGQYINFAPHTVTPIYGDCDEQGPPRAKRSMPADTEDETPIVNNGEMPTKFEPVYYAFDGVDGTFHNQRFDRSQRYCPDREYHPSVIRQKEFEIDGPAPNYEDQLSHLHDPINQYFQTPRGLSYFQQTNLERPNLQDDSCQVSVLNEDQLKEFWATKKW